MAGPSPSPGMDTPVEGVGMLDPIRAAEGFAQAQRAVGVPSAEAFVMTVSVFGVDASRPLWDGFLRGDPRPEDIMGVLDGVAGVDPAAANAWLGQVLSEGRMPSWRDGAFEGVHLEGRKWVKELAGPFAVAGTAFFHDCPSLVKLPDGLGVGHNLNLGGCTALSHLPAGLKVGGILVLSFCLSLRSLPDDMEVGGALDLTNCRALTSIPPGLRVKGGIDCYNCVSLTDLPEGLRVAGVLCLSGCVALEGLPDGLFVGGALELIGCEALRKLPEGLRVGGDLLIGGCDALVSLPVGLHVSSDLSLRECSSWDGRIPEDAWVAGQVFTDDHPDGVKLAQWRRLHGRHGYA